MAGQTICVTLNCEKAHPTSVVCQSQLATDVSRELLSLTCEEIKLIVNLLDDEFGKHVQDRVKNLHNRLAEIINEPLIRSVVDIQEIEQ